VCVYIVGMTDMVVEVAGVVGRQGGRQVPWQQHQRDLTTESIAGGVLHMLLCAFGLA